MWLDAANKALFYFFYGLSGKSQLVDGSVIFLATLVPYLLLAVLLVFLWRALRDSKRRLLILFEGLLAVLLGSGLVAGALRFFYHHPRPFAALGLTPLIRGEATNSFPSEHATFLFSLAILIFSLNRRIGWWYVIFAGLNGLARIYVGVHWPLDILSGAALGLASGYAIHLMVKGSDVRLGFAGPRGNAEEPAPPAE